MFYLVWGEFPGYTIKLGPYRTFNDALYDSLRNNMPIVWS